MKSPKNLILLVLMIVTVGGAALAWKQYQELIELRAAALSNDERATLQKRLWDAEKRAKELADQLAALRGMGASDEEPGTLANTDAPRTDAQNRRGGRGGQRGGPGGGPNAMLALLEQPEIQKLVAMQQKAQLDGRYAALFKSLNLSPEQLEAFKTLLVEKQTAAQDVMAAALAQGINPRDDQDAFRKMIAATQADVDQSIKAAIGEDGFAKYQNYQETASQRNVVSQLQQSLSYTGAPLSDAQAAQLVQILAQTAPKNTGGNRGETLLEANVTVAVGGPGSGRGGGGGFGGGIVNIGFGGGGGGGGGTATITNEAITLAQGVLSGSQVQSLQQLQQQQQAQQQLQQAQQAIRQSQEEPRGNGRTNTNTGGSTTTAPARKG